jgi:hypothetical protein
LNERLDGARHSDGFAAGIITVLEAGQYSRSDHTNSIRIDARFHKMGGSRARNGGAHLPRPRHGAEPRQHYQQSINLSSDPAIIADKIPRSFNETSSRSLCPTIFPGLARQLFFYRPDDIFSIRDRLFSTFFHLAGEDIVFGSDTHRDERMTRNSAHILAIPFGRSRITQPLCRRTATAPAQAAG